MAHLVQSLSKGVPGGNGIWGSTEVQRENLELGFLADSRAEAGDEGVVIPGRQIGFSLEADHKLSQRLSLPGANTAKGVLSFELASNCTERFPKVVVEVVE